MKKYLILLGIPAFIACTGESKKQAAVADSLRSANTNIKNELMDKESLLNSKEAALAEFVSSFNEIQKNLKEIKEKENIISSSTKDKELRKSNKDQIIADIQIIYDLLDKNQAKVASLNKKIKDSNLKVDELEMAITNLNNQSAAKEVEISDLKTRLEKLNVDFANLKVRYTVEQQASSLKTKQLNTAFYVVGTKKDLLKKGLIDKEGGFIGIGRVLEISETLDDNYFTKVDISETKEITIHGDRVKLVSTHPAGSYKLVEGTGSIDKIMILDAAEFWKASKYLVITSEK
jgi:hypothetical protein